MKTVKIRRGRKNENTSWNMRLKRAWVNIISGSKTSVMITDDNIKVGTYREATEDELRRLIIALLSKEVVIIDLRKV